MLDTRNKVLLSVLLCVALVSVSAFVEELDDSFMETRGADDIWLIKFYAPWCTFCKQLDPVWHQIGSELKSLGSPVSVGKSDATTSTGLAKEFRVRGYPAILMLKKGVKYNYSGPRTKDGIMDFAHRVGGSPVRAWTRQLVCALHGLHSAAVVALKTDLSPQCKPPLARSRPVGPARPASAGSQQPGRQVQRPDVHGPPGSACQKGDLSGHRIKILVPRVQMNSRLTRRSSSEAAQPEAGAQEAHLVPPESHCWRNPLESSWAWRRGRWGTRPRSCEPREPRPEPPITPAAMRPLSGTGEVTPLLMKLRRQRGCQRSARQSATAIETSGRKKQDGFTHILLSTKSSENNTLNPEVMKEIQSAMATAASDDSKLVLLGAVGSVFCFGLDFLYFIRRLTDDRKKESIKMAETIRTFVNTFIQFRKPIVAAVNGPALGLGAAILPLCDVVWANEKAWFQTPYTSYGQTPDACSSFTFPRIMGLASANELLLSGRKLTAQEACCKGLVSQVLWPGTFTQEVMLRIKELVTVDSL
ncbi:chromodomain Y-like protein isoform X1, partial [Lates japonicus]